MSEGGAMDTKRKARYATRVNSRLLKLEREVKEIKLIVDELSDISNTLNKIGRNVKFVAPTVIASLVAAGIVSDKVGLFLTGLFG